MKSTNKTVTWKNYIFYLKILGTLNNKVLHVALENFWANAVTKIEGNKHIAVLVRIKTSNGLIKTLGKLIKLNLSNEDKKALSTYFTSNLELKQGGYDQIIINEIIFS